MSDEPINYLEQGLQQGIIELNEDQSRITYFGHNKSRCDKSSNNFNSISTS